MTNTVRVAIEMHAFYPQPDCWLVIPAVLSEASNKTSPRDAGLVINGGEGGIRTLDTLLTHTPLAGERLQPLGHLSIFFGALGGSRTPDLLVRSQMLYPAELPARGGGIICLATY